MVTAFLESVLTSLKIYVEATTAAAIALIREERLQQTSQRREIARLNQQFAGPAKLGDDSLTAHHTPKEARCCLAKLILHRSFPRDEVTSVDDITLTGLQSLAMNRAE